MDHTGSVIDLGEAFGAAAPYINSIVGILLTAGVGYLGNWITTHTKIKVDQATQDMLATALRRQASSLVADGAVSLQGTRVDVKSQVLAQATENLIHANPDTVKRLGLGVANISAMIIDHLPQVPAVAQAQATALAVPAVPPHPVFGKQGTTINPQPQGAQAVMR